MSKLLLNLLVQISKALINSKVKFLIQKFLFFAFGPSNFVAHSAFGLAGSRLPRCPRRSKPPSPAHPARASVASLQEYVFPFGSRLLSWSLLPRLSVKWAPAVSSVPHLRPPELGRATTASRPPRTAQLCASGATEPLPPRHHPPVNSPLNPPPLSSMALKPLMSALTPATPPRRSPDPIKTTPTTPGATHTSPSPSLLLSHAGTPPH
jgi:hypothetical protein